MTLRVLGAMAALILIPAAASDAASDKTKLFTTLVGEEEVPGPGDPDGFGKAKITIVGDTLCFKVKWNNIGTVTGGHIHEAPAGEAGPVVVPLFEDQTDEREKRCLNVDEDVLADIRESPSDYYVNVHTTEFPAGAIRGQL